MRRISVFITVLYILVFVVYLVLFFVLAKDANARELWTDKGFKVEAAGWFESPKIRDHIFIKVGLTIPAGGTVMLGSVENFRFWLPCRDKPVYSTGTIISDGCAPPAPNMGWDTLDYEHFRIMQYMGCEEQAGRILLLVRIPHMFPTSECRPTKVEWVNGGYYAAD